MFWAWWVVPGIRGSGGDEGASAFPDIGKLRFVGNDRKIRVVAAREGEGTFAHLGTVSDEERPGGGFNHFPLVAGEEGVAVPDTFLRKAGASKNGKVGVHFRKGGLAERTTKNTKAVVEGSAGDDGLAGADLIHEGGDGEGVGDNNEPFTEEGFGHGVGRRAAVDHQGHAIFDYLAYAFRDAVFAFGVGVVLSDEVIAPGQVVFDETGSPMMAVDGSIGLKFIEGAPNRGKAGLEPGRKNMEIGIAMFPDVGLDKVEALFVGHAHL